MVGEYCRVMLIGSGVRGVGVSEIMGVSALFFLLRLSSALNRPPEVGSSFGLAFPSSLDLESEPLFFFLLLRLIFGKEEAVGE